MRTIDQNLAVAGDHLRAGDPLRAETVARELVTQAPNLPRAWFILAVAAQLQGKLDEAGGHYRNVLKLDPNNTEALNNLGASLITMRHPDEAEAFIRRAIALAPGYAQARNNLGNALQAQGRHEEAIACYHEALRIHPAYAAAHNHLGLARQAQNRLPEAIAAFSEAIRLAPRDASIRVNRALAWLLTGDYSRGWAEYEWRWGLDGGTMTPLDRPAWEGEPLDGRSILLRSEQGLGDTIQFARFARDLADRGGRVIVEASFALLGLIGTCPGVDRVVAKGRAVESEIDVQIPLLSLPRILGTTVETIPASRSYLSADPAAVARWSGIIGPGDGLKVGIAWQGSPTHKKDHERSFPLRLFGPMAKLPGVRLYSLQKGHGAEQLDAMADGPKITDLGCRFDDMADAAAAMLNLDLVITPDTALGHLAAALGIPTWVALSFAPDWRWLLDRDDSPWYPSIRLFRQAEWNSWPPVFERMANEIQQRLDRRA